MSLTGALLFCSSKSEPVTISCHPEMTFSKLITLIARRLIKAPIFEKTKTRKTFEAGVDASVLRLLARIESEDGTLPNDIDINDAVDLLNQLTPKGESSVVVVDEIDTLPTDELKRSIAHFMKQLGDRGCRTKFVFVGIADDVNELLSHHESASRYMATLKLDRLPINVLRDILTTGFEKLGISIWDDFSMRIATISDGFAHFTHLVGLKLALQIVEQAEGGQPLEVRAEDLPAAINASIQDSEAWMKQAYDKAVQKYKDRYEPVLWAAADHWELDRSTEHMFTSYQRICSDLKREALQRRDFSIALFTLKKPTHGEALVSARLSWYRFRQTMLRGYCRLVAQARGIPVGKDYQVSVSSAAPTRILEAEPEPTTEEVERFESDVGLSSDAT